MSRQNIDVCPICHIKSKIENRVDLYSVHCPKCGFFQISGTAFATFGDFNPRQQANISGWIRENQSYLFSSDDKKMLSDLNTPQIGEKAKKLLVHLSYKYPIAGLEFAFPNFMLTNITEFLNSKDISLKTGASEFLDYLGYSWSINENELRFIFKKYLLEEKGFISGHPNYIITPKGWAYLDEIRDINVNADVVFIASKYEENINKYLDKYVVSALEELGYKPKLMRSHPHTNIIDNEMISLIKKSRFVIVDLTENSLGAYYEAGYAQGLGLEVIYTCEKSFRENKNNESLKGVHFDTSHYPINDWEFGDNQGMDFKKKMLDFINVKFGKGTYYPE